MYLTGLFELMSDVFKSGESSIGDGGFNAFSSKIRLNRTIPYTTFPFYGKLKKEHNTGHNTGGGRAGPGGDCEAIGEAPSKRAVGSFTKRSEVERRARVAD